MKISIITITYNAEKFLDRTIQSILNQTDQNFEYLIIDGKSKDATLEIANRYKSRVDVLVSEPDKGLYDAMNKGLALATGEYVWFMNAGDLIAENDAIFKLKTMFLNSPDIVYSDTIMMSETGSEIGLRSDVLPHKIPTDLTWQKFKLGMLVCHQSFIVRRTLAPLYLMDNLSADIDWEIKCLKASKLNIAYPGILSKYLIGGVSNKRQFKSWKDRYFVLQSHFGVLPNMFNHVQILIRAMFRKVL